VKTLELIDAKAINLPTLDRMYKEYSKGRAPATLEELAQKIRAADGFVFVTGEYNWASSPVWRVSASMKKWSGAGAIALGGYPRFGP
jgi:multimeric flavodoxin WrbA